ATTNGTIKTFSFAGTGAVGGGAGAGIAASGAGAGSRNTIVSTTEAKISGGSDITSNSTVTLSASDTAAIHADAGSAALAAGVGVAGGAAVSAIRSGDPSGCVTIAGACRAHQIRALIDGGSVVGSLFDKVSKVTVKAESTGVIKALAYAGVAAVAVGAGGGVA